MLEILRAHFEKIVSLTDEEFEIVSGYFQPKRFRKHQIVVQEGESVPYDFFVIRGLMKVYRMDADGSEHIVQFAPEDWWITDAQAYHNRAKATLNVDCLEPTEVFAISADNREKLCLEVPKMQYFFLKKTTAGYIALQKRVLCFISSNAGDRYNNLISLYPGLLQRVSKGMIASYLGVSRETLSRLNAEL